jgi:tRNA nucleotidyltransferase (CCA-adding enzyme)
MVKYYIVGGYVRDTLLGIKSKDVDFAVEAESYDHMKQDLIARGVTIFLESPEYFTIRGSHPDFGGVDYVLCRKDGEYVDGRHPETVVEGTILDDLARRDFTINAMALGEDGILIDPLGGQQDLKNKTIRCVGKPSKRFQEDALRILRAIRFAIRLGFLIETETFVVMKALAATISSIPQERVREELHKCFSHDTLLTLAYLNQLGLTGNIFNKYNGLWLMPTNRNR